MDDDCLHLLLEVALTGVYTLIFKQSSLPAPPASPPPVLPCTQKSGYLLASMTLPFPLDFNLEVSRGTGARNRRSPTGGSAYGTPRNARLKGSVKFPRYFAYPTSTMCESSLLPEKNAAGFARQATCPKVKVTSSMSVSILLRASPRRSRGSGRSSHLEVFILYDPLKGMCRTILMMSSSVRAKYESWGRNELFISNGLLLVVTWINMGPVLLSILIALDLPKQLCYHSKTWQVD